jgi:hypothetical protein
VVIAAGRLIEALLTVYRALPRVCPRRFSQEVLPAPVTEVLPVRVLGINAVFHDPAAALVVDGQIVAAAGSWKMALIPSTRMGTRATRENRFYTR